MGWRQTQHLKMQRGLRALQRIAREGRYRLYADLKKASNRTVYDLLARRGYEWRDQRWQMTPKYRAARLKLKKLEAFSPRISANGCYAELKRRRYKWIDGRWIKQTVKRTPAPAPQPVALTPVARAKPASKTPAYDEMSPDELIKLIQSGQVPIRARKRGIG
jgi:hypothetical protein